MLSNLSSNLILRSFTRGFTKQAVDGASRFHSELTGRQGRSVAQQIRSKLKLGYDVRDLTVQNGNKVIVNPDSIEQRMFEKIFGKPKKVADAPKPMASNPYFSSASSKASHRGLSVHA